MGRLYLLPKIHKRLRNVPGRPVISNCGTSTERVSEFLDHRLKPIMKAGKSYIRDTGHFLDKLKEIGKVSENELLVTADVTSLYPSIPHQDGLRARHTKLEEREDKKALLAWWNLCLKIIILNLIHMFIFQFLGQPWAPNLILRIHAFLWIWQRLRF